MEGIETSKRRKHRKSRLGCAECKRRHVRCDETRPSCANCRVAGYKCPYVSNSASAQSPLSADAISRPSATRTSSTFGNTPSAGSTPATPLTPCTSTDISSEVNVVHLRLFHYYMTEGYSPVPLDEARSETVRNVLATYAFSCPFLLHSMLAFAASRLAHDLSDREEKATYQTLASSLQSKALAGFNEALPLLDASNCVPYVLFSHTVGLHSFCETFSFAADSAAGFLESLMQTINLLRGVRQVISPFWVEFLVSDIGPFVQTASARMNAASTEGPEADELNRLLEEADISHSTRQVYLEAVKRLQRDMNAYPLTAVEDSSTGIFSWLITAEQEYSTLLEERRPEALALLAWFAIILYRHRASKIVRGSGRDLFRLIESYLGPRWHTWLARPRQEIMHADDTEAG